MKEPIFNKALVSTVAILVIAASGLGLLVPGFYAARDNAMTVYEIAGQDMISLIVGALLLVFVLCLPKGGVFSMVVAGLLVNTGYIYSYFAFGLLSSRIYAAYLAIAGLSLFSLVRALILLDRGAQPAPRPGAKAVGAYLIIVVALVGALDAKDIVMKTVLTDQGMSPKDVFYVLDLAFLFPAMILAAVLNARGAAIGSFLAGAVLVKAIALMPALILSDLLRYANTGAFADLGFDVIAFAVMLSAAAFFAVHARGIRLRP